VRYPGGVRRIYWNPDHNVRVPVPAGAVYRQTGLGARQSLGRRASTVHVSYQPVMVDSPR
jgi:hypothetical protein